MAAAPSNGDDEAMRTHVGLLSGVNVGKHNQLAMSDLRDIAERLGYGDVATYIRSGNVVFSSPGRGATELALELEAAIGESADVRTRVVVLSRDELATAVAANPYPQEADPKRLHVVFHRDPIGPDAVADVAAAQERASAKGSQDKATARGSCLYLRTPDGLGRSVLAAELGRRRGGGAQEAVHTMRNWATVTRLLELLDADA